MGDEGAEVPTEPTEPAEPAVQTEQTEPAEPVPEQTAEPAPPVEEPKTEELQPEEPKTEEPSTEEPKTEEPKTEEPKTDEPKPDEAKTEESKPEEPKVEEPKPEEPTPEETQTEEPKPDESKPDELKPEETKPEAPKPEGTVEPSDTVEEAAPTAEVPEAQDKKSSVIEKKPSQEDRTSKTSRDISGSKISSKSSIEKAKAGFAEAKAKTSGELKVQPSSESLTKKVRSSGKEDSKETRKVSRTDRLSSKAQKVLGSTISIRRLSTIGEFYDRSKTARYMNTYKLDADNPFNSEKVQKILESVMIEALENLTYDAETCPKQAKWASSAIRAKVKELQFDRYKLVCLVTIGEKNSQDILVTCRFLWDIERDRYATYSIENTYVYGIAQCFGFYYE